MSSTRRTIPGRSLVQFQVAELESGSPVGESAPTVLRGELHLGDATAFTQIASYCATFEKKFALATRFAAEGIKADPKLLDQWLEVAKFAGWAVQAGVGHGADADTTPLIGARALSPACVPVDARCDQASGNERRYDEFLPRVHCATSPRFAIRKNWPKLPPTSALNGRSCGPK